MYICFIVAKEDFIGGCRRLMGIDGCFLKGLLKGKLLVVVGRMGGIPHSMGNGAKGNY